MFTGQKKGGVVSVSLVGARSSMGLNGTGYTVLTQPTLINDASKVGAAPLTFWHRYRLTTRQKNKKNPARMAGVGCDRLNPKGYSLNAQALHPR